jgi:hypothetical protein
MRELVGLSSTSAPPLQATLTGAIAHDPHPRPGTLVTISFTIGQTGKPAGSGIASDSYGLVLVYGKAAGIGRDQLLTAEGANGRFTAPIRVPSGGIEGIAIGIVEGAAGGGLDRSQLSLPITNDPYGTR